MYCVLFLPYFEEITTYTFISLNILHNFIRNTPLSLRSIKSVGFAFPFSNAESPILSIEVSREIYSCEKPSLILFILNASPSCCLVRQ